MESKKAFKSIKDKLTALMGEAVALCKELDEKDKPQMQLTNELIGVAYKSLLISEGILFPAAKVVKKPPAIKYGEYGWVKLTEAQHENLEKQYGKELLARAITYIDESAQKTSNKNGWKDWSLVIHKCIREDWGKVVSHPQQPQQTEQNNTVANIPQEGSVDRALLEQFMNS